VCGLGSLTKAQIRPLIVSSLADAPNRLSGYVFGSNPYGITLDCAWIAWAAKERVSETVAAAVRLICQNRPAHEVVAKLTPWEFERVVDIVRRSPDRFPSGTLAALESRCPIPARRPAADSVPADQAPLQSSKPESGKERGSIGNLFGIALDQASLRWAVAEGMTETVIAAVSLLHERSVEEIAGKLTPAELADVTRLVSRCPSCYPPGAFDALKALRNVAAEQPAACAPASTAANRPLRRHRRASSPPTERAGLAERANREGLPGANAEKPGHNPGHLPILFDGAWWSMT